MRRLDPLEQVEHPEWIARLDGPQVVPRGRHIQYLFYNQPHGISDRMGQHFRFLVALGRYHNATVHIQGGSAQASNWLDSRHSNEVAQDWDRYFNTRANGGSPWHPLENFRRCKSVFKGADLWNLFGDGSRCVNIYDHIRGFPSVVDFLRLSDEDSLLPVSHHITVAARDFMERFAMPESYGSIHIRRCDRGIRGCTDPQRIYDVVQQHNTHSTWVVFLYAEPGYAEALHEKLRPLKRRFLFEGEVDFNHAFPLDNYFTYLLGRYLNSKAATILETHQCGKATAPMVYKGAGLAGGIFLNRWADDRWEDDDEALENEEFEAEEHLGAVCKNATKGATLQKDPAKDTLHGKRRVIGREYAHEAKDPAKDTFHGKRRVIGREYAHDAKDVAKVPKQASTPRGHRPPKAVVRQGNE